MSRLSCNKLTCNRVVSVVMVFALQTNVSVCTSLGNPFLSQMVLMSEPMLQLYRLYSEMISRAITEGGPHAARSSFVKYMRGVKKAVLRLIEVFVEKCEDESLLATKFVPALMDPVLGDYARNVPDARWVSVHDHDSVNHEH